jgi:hypothetical protein
VELPSGGQFFNIGAPSLNAFAPIVTVRLPKPPIPGLGGRRN